MSEPIPITRPLFGPEELEAVRLPLENGWVVQGPFVAQFEAAFARFAETPDAVATSSCTTALHIAVAALDLSPGDEVIVPAFTWVSTANVVEYMGARPVFCDIDLTTFNIDVERIEELITERTVGVIPVHLFGLCADMGRIMEIAARRGLWVVEDAACAFGARLEGRHAGTFGDAGCFSFHPRKSITTGEGGMIITERGDLARISRSLRDHGASRSDLERHQSTGSFLLADYERLGYNYRMTDLQAAVGCAQMERADWILGRRVSLAQRYDEALGEMEWFATPSTQPRSVHGYQAYVGLFRPETPCLQNVRPLNDARNRLMKRLEQKGVATRPGTHAAALTGYYARKYKTCPEQFPNASLAERLSLALPLYPQMTAPDQDRVVDELRAAYAGG